MKKFLKKALEKKGKSIVSTSRLEQLRKKALEADELLELMLKREKVGAESRAQLKQDILALIFSNFKRGGFFVEFGATDGETLSNTALLEKEFGWKGILAEPGRIWHDKLRNNRECVIDTRCVWHTSGEFLDFNETAVAHLSTVSEFSSKDFHAKKREGGKSYTVETVSLSDLLLQHHAPKEIDYLSIDTEGSELDILRAFDFSPYEIKFISCEHNFTEDRQKIFQILSNAGYARVLTGASEFDDWYIKKEL